jgi:hypothetical protein
MGTDKPRISTVAQLAQSLAHLELALAEPAVPGLVPVHRVWAAATDQVAVEHKISGPLIDRVAEPVQEISVAAIVLAVAQVPVVPVAELARCRLSGRPVLLAEMVSEIVVSHPAQDSVRVATLLVGVGLTEALLDRQVTAEVPAWEAVDSAMVAAGAAGVDAVAAGVVEDRQTVLLRKTNEDKTSHYNFVENFFDRLCDCDFMLVGAYLARGDQNGCGC